MKLDPDIQAVPTGISDRGRLAALAGVIAALTAFGLAQGLSYPLFTLLMQRQGYSPALIGLSAAVMPIGIILSAPLVPRLANLVGAPAVAVGCAMLGAVCFTLIGLMQDWVAWFVVRFFIGIAINPLYILGETWALGLAPPGKRGRVMGVFNAVMGAGYAAGPLALAAVGPDGWIPFSIGVGGFSLCALILFAVSPQLSAADGPRGTQAETSGLLTFATTAPALLLAVGVSAAVSMSAYSLLPVFGAGYGLAEATLATLVMALSVGNIILQIPLGFAAERFGGRAMMLACAASTALCALMLPLLIGTPAIWPLLIILGGIEYGIYTMALVELGDRFTGRTLVAGNAAFAVMWGMGGIVGPPGAGILMETIGPIGLPTVVVVLTVSLVVFSVWRTSRRGKT